MNIAFPFSVTNAGRTMTCDRPAYIAQLIELTLFTAPGERVNRPDFGSGVQDLVFSAAGSHAATATTALVEGALQHALRDLVELRSFELSFQESKLQIDVTFIDRQTALQHTLKLERQL